MTHVNTAFEKVLESFLAYFDTLSHTICDVLFIYLALYDDDKKRAS